MGMDVYGKEPTSETGKYFRNNVWWWQTTRSRLRRASPQRAVIGTPTMAKDLMRRRQSH